MKAHHQGKGSMSTTVAVRSGALKGAKEAEVQDGVLTATSASHRRHMESLEQKARSLTAHSKER